MKQQHYICRAQKDLVRVKRNLFAFIYAVLVAMIASDVMFFGVENKNTFDFHFCSFFDSKNSWKIILFFAQKDFKRTEFRLFHKLRENTSCPHLGKK